MALDTIAGIREYRDQVADKAIEDPKTVIAMQPGTMLRILDTLLEEIDREVDRQTSTSRNLESVTVTPLHKRRRLQSVPKMTHNKAPDLI